jgi:hypothetical protein
MQTQAQQAATRRVWLVAGGVVLLLTPLMIGKLLSGDVKDAPVWYDAGRRVLAGQSLIGLRSYRYPPTFAVLMAPLAALPFSAYFIIWYLLNAGFFVLIVRQATALASGNRAHSRAPVQIWLPALLVSVYAVDNLLLAQTNLLVTALVYASLCYLARDREWAAGVPLAAAIAIKVFPAPMLAYLLYRWRLRAAAATLLSTVFFLLVLPGPVRGLRRNYQEVKGWGLRVVEPYLTQGKAGDWGQHALDFGNQSIQAVAHRYLTRVDANVAARRGRPIYVNIASLSERPINLIVACVFALLAGAFVAACGWRRPDRPQGEATEYSLVVIGLLLVSAISWTYFFVMMALPVAVAVRLLTDTPAATVHSRRVLWLALFLFVMATALLQVHYLRALGSVCLASIALYAALALACWHLRRRTASVAQACPGDRPVLP